MGKRYSSGVSIFLTFMEPKTKILFSRKRAQTQVIFLPLIFPFPVKSLFSRNSLQHTSCVRSVSEWGRNQKRNTNEDRSVPEKKFFITSFLLQKNTNDTTTIVQNDGNNIGEVCKFVFTMHTKISPKRELLCISKVIENFSIKIAITTKNWEHLFFTKKIEQLIFFGTNCKSNLLSHHSVENNFDDGRGKCWNDKLKNSEIFITTEKQVHIESWWLVRACQQKKICKLSSFLLQTKLSLSETSRNSKLFENSMKWKCVKEVLMSSIR